MGTPSTREAAVRGEKAGRKGQRGEAYGEVPPSFRSLPTARPTPSREQELGRSRYREDLCKEGSEWVGRRAGREGKKERTVDELLSDGSALAVSGSDFNRGVVTSRETLDELHGRKGQQRARRGKRKGAPLQGRRFR